ncbi:hypothetical protein EDD27_4258 [Nonomuraea polychroma]|uniref:Immunoglobulin-like protein involved in spore germination n=1 Tax=Nonomuraea polychroma TaxID=46176 RepID=A0A438M7I9_9ACTN|nr:hypothetical protein [Nonomuraea polychroma]RVX41693.1 hypothetical protein EDD27_4258 [Nonomuraea polychroma]
MRPRMEHALPLLIAFGLALTGCGGESPRETPAATASPPPTAPPPTLPATSPSPGATRSPASPPTPGGEERLVAGYYQPLWPFATLAEAQEWQRAHRADGRGAWHLDPARTAIAFSRDHLGFKEIDRAVKTVTEGRHARVHVGFRAEEGPRPLVAAIVHLVRYGSGRDAPWEVVGTDDTSLTLTTPKYGAAVGSPLTVGGRITGVDESIRIQVRGKSVVGEECCLPAGGENTPWSARVSFTPAPGRTLTIVASTGGHVADVERFAVTGVTMAQ